MYMNEDDTGREFTVGWGPKADKAHTVHLCRSCAGAYEDMMRTFLVGGQNWTSVWGVTTVTLTDDGSVQTRIDDDRQPWNGVGE